MTGDALNFRELWQRAMPYMEFVEQAEENRSLWEGIYRTARIPDWAFEMACERGRGQRLIALAEDWCGDASNTVPVLARLGDEADCLEMRILRRDGFPEVMDRYLTNGARSIPIVIVFNERFEELGHWGPRPSELQTWVMENKASLPADELYPRIRRWYATDRGQATLTEVLRILEED